MRSLAVAIVALTATMVHAQSPEDWKHWRYSASIQAGETATDRYVAIPVPIQIVDQARHGLGDLRVVDRERREVPYVLRARTGGINAEWHESRVLDQSAVAKSFAQAIGDTGASARVHNAARLGFDTTEDFLSWVEVAASDDAREWRVLRERAPVYKLRAEGMGEHLTLNYPETPSRYIRFRILDGTTTVKVVGIETAYETETAAELTPAPLSFAATTTRPQHSAFVASGALKLPIAAFTITTTQPLFDRPLSVEVSQDGSEWRHLASGHIYRVVEHGQERSSLDVRVPETAAPYWRVTVYDRNDRPLPDLAVHAETIPRRVVFRQQPSERYRLLFGNDEASAPQYELARLTDAASLDAATVVTIGNSEPNANYADPAPWTERHPVVVWSGLVLIVLALGLLAMRTLKSA
jgi:hypothetical protein